MLIDHETRIKIAEWAMGLVQDSTLGLSQHNRASAHRFAQKKCDEFAATGRMFEMDRPVAFSVGEEG